MNQRFDLHPERRVISALARDEREPIRFRQSDGPMEDITCPCPPRGISCHSVPPFRAFDGEAPAPAFTAGVDRTILIKNAARIEWRGDVVWMQTRTNNKGHTLV